MEMFLIVFAYVKTFLAELAEEYQLAHEEVAILLEVLAGLEDVAAWPYVWQAQEADAAMEEHEFVVVLEVLVVLEEVAALSGLSYRFCRCLRTMISPRSCPI